MKIIAIIAFTLLLARGCTSDSRQDFESAVIEYNVTTRGFFRHVTAENGEVKVWSDRNMKETPQIFTLGEQDRKAFIDAFTEVDLEEIPNHKAPSDRRFFDGAAIASLKISYKGKSYQSQAFDHMNPPAEIARLVNIMAAYTRTHE